MDLKSSENDVYFESDEIIFFRDDDSRFYPVRIVKPFSMRQGLHDYGREHDLPCSVQTNFSGQPIGDGPIMSGVVMDLFVDWLVEDKFVSRLAYRSVFIDQCGIPLSDISKTLGPNEYVFK